jgi:hypothetical protein
MTSARRAYEVLFSGEDRLAGYILYFARDRQNDVRSKIESLYGPPTRQWEMGRSIAWLWPSGTEAVFTIVCRGTNGCLIVKAKELALRAFGATAVTS